MKFRALNESSSSLEGDEDLDLATNEAQEEEAYSMYNLALKAMSISNFENAKDLFNKVLELDLITQIKPQEEDEEENSAAETVRDAKCSKNDKTPLRPALNIKYLTLKNLATIANEEMDYKSSVSSFLQALEIDSTDVVVWYSTGMAALQLSNYQLSRLCFHEGLKRNPQHWPCLSNLTSLTYVLNDYADCLHYVATALELEPNFLKGLVLKDQIFKEDPSLKIHCSAFFKECDPSINFPDYDREEADKIMEELFSLREKNRSLSKGPAFAVLKLPHIKELTWKAVGDSLILIYDYIMSSTDSSISLHCELDIDVENAGKFQISETFAPGLDMLSEGKTVPSMDSTGKDDDSPNASGLNLIACSEPAAEEMIDYVEAATNNRKPAKRKRSLLSELSVFCGKRRSTRVKNTAKPDINYQLILHSLLPPALIGDNSFDGEDDDMWHSRNNINPTCGQSCELNNADDGVIGKSQFCQMEEEDVKHFISSFQNKNGLIHLMYNYVCELGVRSNSQWPKKLPGVFASVFVRLRKHITMPNLFTNDTETELVIKTGFAILAFWELKVDQFYCRMGFRSNSKVSFSSKMPGINQSFQNESDPILKTFRDDIDFITNLRAISDTTTWDFSLRVFWLKTKFHAVQGEVELALQSIEELSSLLQKDDSNSLVVTVANSVFSNQITSATVQQQLESLQRCQSLEEIQRLFENGSYQSVVDLLVVTFGPNHSKPKVSGDGAVPERHVQLMLLQDSLLKLENYKECVKWTEVSFKESIQQYMNASSSSSKNDWTYTMSYLLTSLERCAKTDITALSVLEQSKLVRLTQNLILVICLQMDSYDVTIFPSLIVLPWIILYRLISNEEFKEKSANRKRSSQDTEALEVDILGNMSDPILLLPDSDSSMPSSLLLLITAHDCLGRRGSCCVSDGLFLLQSMDIIMEKLQYSSVMPSYRKDLETSLEQSIYCLYGHPTRRTKAKHLQEHNSPQVLLTWERAVQIYNYFKPQILPEFDSYKTSTVSAELENLLKRIIPLVPPALDPSGRIDLFGAYIEGAVDKCPTYFLDMNGPCAAVKDIFYLLGDYYFKNKEFSKAIRYYLMDVCINPKRLDSWAGMALSRSSQLDQKLNSYEVRNESAIWRKASAALRCFEHALQLETSTNSLWIEYGSLAYVLHSHASRQLKLNTYMDGPRELLNVKKVEMLHLAERCFKEANKSDGNTEPEEAWLHHYMLGKIFEKCGKAPSLFLSHYQKSLSYLHEDGARYPHKIQYHNPPELSIEVLEVFYRIHAICLKYLCKYENKGIPLKVLKVFENCLAEVAAGPFAKLQEKVKFDEFGSDTLSDCENSLRLASDIENLPYVPTSTQEPHLLETLSVDHGNSSKAFPSSSCSSKTTTSHFDVVLEVMESMLSAVSSWNETDFVECKPTHQSFNIQQSKVHAMELELIETNHSDDIDKLLIVTEISQTKFKLMESTSQSRPSSIVKDSPSKVKSPHVNSDDAMSSDQLVSALARLRHEYSNLDEMTEDLTTTSSTVDPVYPLCAKPCDSVNDISTEAKIIIDELTNKAIANANLQHTLSGKISDCDITEMKFAGPNETIEQHQNSSDLPKRTDKVANSSNSVKPPKNSNEEDAFHMPDVDETEVKESKVRIQIAISNSLNGLRECLKRFIQHYKSLYRLAHHFCNSADSKNLQWSREILLAAIPAVTNYPSMPGLFAERKNTNFFNGIWRAPSNEIDRPGSFGSHMYRSVCLLIDVLSKQNDYNMLLYLTQQLHRNPDLGKKYMRDGERVSLARTSYDSCICILSDQMNSLLQEEPPPEESRLTCCLLEIYRTYQTLLKSCIYVEDSNKLLENAYVMYKLGEIDRYPSVLDQAILFCQQQLGKSYQVTPDTNRVNSIIKQTPVLCEVPSDSIKSPIPSSSFTPDAWQQEFAKSLMMPKYETGNLSDVHVVQESVLLIPVGKGSVNVIPNTATSQQTTSSQLVHVEKPRAENLRACSVAFLPVMSGLPTTSRVTTVANTNPSLLSCQAYQCYDILETLMHASGYRVLPQAGTVNAIDMSTNSAKTSDSCTTQKPSTVNVIKKRSWRSWGTKTVKQKSSHLSPSSQQTSSKDPTQ